MESRPNLDCHGTHDEEKMFEHSQLVPSRGERAKARRKDRRLSLVWTLVTLASIAGLILGAFQLGIRKVSINDPSNLKSGQALQLDKMVAQVNPPDGYPIPVQYGSIGPRLLAAGAIDLQKFEQIYAQSGKPLTDAQKAILSSGSADEIRIDAYIAPAATTPPISRIAITVWLCSDCWN